jgi:hypothetical protein
VKSILSGKQENYTSDVKERKIYNGIRTETSEKKKIKSREMKKNGLNGEKERQSNEIINALINKKL